MPHICVIIAEWMIQLGISRPSPSTTIEPSIEPVHQFNQQIDGDTQYTQTSISQNKFNAFKRQREKKKRVASHAI